VAGLSKNSKKKSLRRLQKKLSRLCSRSIWRKNLKKWKLQSPERRLTN